jgi:hypothetical protein
MKDAVDTTRLTEKRCWKSTSGGGPRMPSSIGKIHDAGQKNIVTGGLKT